MTTASAVARLDSRASRLRFEARMQGRLCRTCGTLYDELPEPPPIVNGRPICLECIDETQKETACA